MNLVCGAMVRTKKEEEVVISLTSYPAAMPYVIPAIKSLLRGAALPDRLVLYLTASQFPDGKVPEELLRLKDENPLFEIRFYDKDIRSYTKLIPALKDFPEAVIVTVDDDQRYHRNMLKDLLKVHSMFDDVIVAHRVRRVAIDTPYSKWKKYKWPDFLFHRYHPRFGNLQTGVGGVLYPPHSLKEEMLGEDLFMALAPTTDDIWFWAAAVANGTKIIPVPFGVSAPHGVGKPASLSLMTQNYASGTDKNLKNFNAILEKYPEIRTKLNAE